MESRDAKRKSPSDILRADRRQELGRGIKKLMQTIRPGDYVALQAYLSPDSQTDAGLQKLRNFLRDRFHITRLRWDTVRVFYVLPGNCTKGDRIQACLFNLRIRSSMT
jgi:hypothetical protein